MAVDIAKDFRFEDAKVGPKEFAKERPPKFKGRKIHLTFKLQRSV